MVLIPEPHWDVPADQPPMTIVAGWVDAPTGYRLHWGDDTSSLVAAGRTARHRYAQPGPYRLWITTEQDAGPAVLVLIEDPPAVEVRYLSMGDMQVFLPAPPSHRAFTVDWGKGWGSVEIPYGADDAGRTVQRHYYEGMGSAVIRVLDHATRRTTTVDAPAIEDYRRGVLWETTDPAGHIGHALLKEYPAGTRLTLTFDGVVRRDPVVIDTAGRAVVPLAYDPTPGRWQSVAVVWDKPDGAQELSFLSVEPAAMTPRSRAIAFDFDHAPSRAPLAGWPTAWVNTSGHDWHKIAWGDKTIWQRKPYFGWIAFGPKEFTQGGPVDFDVLGTAAEFPGDDRTGRIGKYLGPSTLDTRINWVTFYDTFAAPGRTCDITAMLRVKVVSPRGPVRWLQTNQRGTCDSNYAVRLHLDQDGEHEITYYRPFADPLVVAHTSIYSGKEEFGLVHLDDSPKATATFHVGDIRRLDRYTGWFDLTNTDTATDAEVAWRLDFLLGEEARVASVESRSGTAELHDLGHGRWQVTGDTPIPPGETTRLDIVVDPAGTPTAWPDRVTLRTTHQTP